MVQLPYCEAWKIVSPHASATSRISQVGGVASLNERGCIKLNQEGMHPKCIFSAKGRGIQKTCTENTFRCHEKNIREQFFTKTEKKYRIGQNIFLRNYS